MATSNNRLSDTGLLEGSEILSCWGSNTSLKELDILPANAAEVTYSAFSDGPPEAGIQLPFSNLSVNCDSYKVATIWAIIAHELGNSLNRNFSS